jgi:hypothetical protein
MAVRLSALRTGRLYPQENSWYSIQSTLSAIVRLERLGALKNPMTSSGIEPATFRLVVWCVNQVRYRMHAARDMLRRQKCSVT